MLSKRLYIIVGVSTVFLLVLIGTVCGVLYSQKVAVPEPQPNGVLLGDQNQKSKSPSRPHVRSSTLPNKATKESTKTSPVQFQEGTLKEQEQAVCSKPSQESTGVYVMPTKTKIIVVGGIIILALLLVGSVTAIGVLVTKYKTAGSTLDELNAQIAYDKDKLRDLTNEITTRSKNSV